MLFVLGSQTVLAQEFPTKPITLIVPYGPGGSFDLIGRAFTSVAVDYLKQPIIFQLKPGGGGAIGTELVAKAAPDGYTLLLAGPGPTCTLPAIEGISKGPNDFIAICRINKIAGLVMVRTDSPFKTFKGVLDYAKANPGKLTYGNAGTWGPSDLPWRLVKMETGIVTRDIPHDGGGPCLMALLGGHIQVSILLPTQSLPQIKAGKLRALATLDSKRDPEVPDVPTLLELGVKVVSYSWKGFAAPKGTPRPIIEKLAMAFNKMSKDKSVLSMIKQLGDELEYLGPEEFAKVWREEYEALKELGKTIKK